MTVTRLGSSFPLLTSGFGSSTEVPSGGVAGQVVTANGSNGSTWGENIARITANGSNANTLVGPFVNIAAGSNTYLSTASNTLTIGSTGGGGSALTVEEVDGSPTDSAVTKLVFPNGTLGIAGHVATYTPAASGGGTLLASIAAASAAIAATETVVVYASLAANYLTAGMTFRIRAAGVGTTGLTPGVDTFRIRLGTTTLTGNIITSVAPPANGSVTDQPFSFEAILTLRTAGAGGAIIGECQAFCDNGATGLFTLLVDLSATTATVAVDTTATKLLELTFQSGAAGSSCTFHVAEIEVLTTGPAGSTSGSVNPAQPAYGTNVPFYRTDLKLLIVYDGTRWLCVCGHSSSMAVQVAVLPTSTGASIYLPVPYPITSSIRLLGTSFGAVVNTTNNGSNYWNFTSPTGATANTSAATAGVNYHSTSATEATIGVASTDQSWMQLDYSKTGAPGSVYLFMDIPWRYIVT